jgi:hypothetical protein
VTRTTTGTSHFAVPDRDRRLGGAPIIVWGTRTDAVAGSTHPRRMPTGYELRYRVGVKQQNIACRCRDAAANVAGWVPPTVLEYIDSQYARAKAGLRLDAGRSQLAGPSRPESDGDGPAFTIFVSSSRRSRSPRTPSVSTTSDWPSQLGHRSDIDPGEFAAEQGELVR